MKYVIVGGGVAGTTAAEELRKLDSDGEIILISQEQHPLYSRVLLPHYLKGLVERERVFLKKESWYEEKNIEWLRGVEVVKCDTKNKFVELSDGRELPYDKLLIASGNEPRVVDGDVRGVSYLRSLDDADHLKQLLNERKKGDPAAVWGGGLIACEYLNLFVAHELPTTIALRGQHFWSKNLNEEAGEFLNEHLRQQGVKILTEQKFLGVEGEKELEGMKLENQKVECDILGIGIGVQSDLGWIKDAEIEVDRGVKVNEFLETNVEDVWAVGDVAEYFDVVANRHIMFGNWQKAMSQGRVVAKSMAGERSEYQQVPSYAMEILGLDITFVGDVELAAADKVLVRKGDEHGPTLMLMRDNKLVGAVVMGRNSDRVPLTKVIDQRTGDLAKVMNWQGIDQEILA
ncbi:FAD-dependent oxidoreductase [Patescibacteria group bacterium]|nr:FAD-dependent oxidoreductase [Patescibacteria group bacterium]MBU1705500.1 FAD-dependent oxidoreductase [Patescibacteria group bacterium]